MAPVELPNDTENRGGMLKSMAGTSGDTQFCFVVWLLWDSMISIARIASADQLLPNNKFLSLKPFEERKINPA